MAKINSPVVTPSSGNVFADLGLPNAEESHAKVRLAVAINNILDARKLTQTEAAKVLGVNQPKVSALRGYKLEGFSVGRLMNFATLLKHDVVIEIRPRPAAKGDARIVIVGAKLKAAKPKVRASMVA